MPIEAVKIPQNVQVEDRLIGPITLRQVMICLAGGGISFVIWNAMKSIGTVTPVHFVVAWIPLVIAAAFAFVKIRNLSLLRIILLQIEKAQKPSKRTFGPRTGIAINIRTYFHTEQKKRYSIDQTRVAQDKFEHLSSVLDKEAAHAPHVGGGITKDTPEEPEEDTPIAEPKPVNPSRVSAEPTDAAQPSIDGVQPPNPPSA